MEKEKEDYGLNISERGCTAKNMLMKLPLNATVLYIRRVKILMFVELYTSLVSSFKRCMILLNLHNKPIKEEALPFPFYR